MATEPKDGEQEDIAQYESIMPEDAPFEDGFNVKTIWATLFVGIVMLPGAIYLGLVTGQSMAGASEWVTIILFLEIAKRSFVRLKTQELIVIYWVAGGLLGLGARLGSGAHMYGGPFGGLIWDQYLIQSPAAKGLAKYIPDWVVPPLDTPVYVERTFVHSAWIKPVLILFTVMVILRTAHLAFGYIMFPGDERHRKSCPFRWRRYRRGAPRHWPRARPSRRGGAGGCSARGPASV